MICLWRREGMTFRMFRLVLLFASVVLSAGQSVSEIKHFGPDYALQTVLTEYLYKNDGGQAAREEVSFRLIGYWRQILHILPAMTDVQESEALDKAAKIPKEQLEEYVLSTQYIVASTRRFAKGCTKTAIALRDKVTSAHETEAYHWLRMMGCYADNPGVFFRFNALGIVDRDPLTAMGHFELLARYVSGPLASTLERRAVRGALDAQNRCSCEWAPGSKPEGTRHDEFD